MNNEADGETRTPDPFITSCGANVTSCHIASRAFSVCRHFLRAYQEDMTSRYVAFKRACLKIRLMPSASTRVTAEFNRLEGSEWPNSTSCLSKQSNI